MKELKLRYLASLVEIKSVLKSWYKWLPLIIITIFLFALLIIFAIDYTTSLSILNPKGELQKIACNKYWGFTSLIGFHRSIIVIAIFILIPLLVFITYLTFPIIKMLITLFYSLFYPLDVLYENENYHYQTFIKRTIGNSIYLIFIPILIATAIIFIKWQMNSYTSYDLGRFIIITIFIYTPIVYFLHWFIYIKIFLKKKRNNSYPEFYFNYFFSKHSFLASFRTILSFMLWCSLLLRLVIPIFYETQRIIVDNSYNSLVKNYDYVDWWTCFANNHQNLIHLSDINIISPENLKNFLSALPPYNPLDNPEYYKIISLAFLLIVFVGFIEIGIRTITFFSLKFEKRKVIKKIFTVTLKTFLFSILIQALISGLFYVDFNSIIGFGTIVLFSLSLFFTIEATRK